MRFLRCLLISLGLLLAAAPPVFAQNHTTNITLANLLTSQGLTSEAPAPYATVCATPSDVYGNLVAVSATGWGLINKGTNFCGSVVTGAIAGGFNVPDANHTNAPGPIYYNILIQITNSTGSPIGPATILTAVPNVSGTSYSLDDYAPSVASAIPSGALVTAPGSPSVCVGSSLYLDTSTNGLYGCNAGSYALLASTGFNLRGAWAASTTYHLYDVVQYNGGSYVATATFTSGSSWDGTNFTQLASPGSAGAAGANGIASLPQLSSLLATYPLNQNVLDPTKLQVGYYLTAGSGALGGGGGYSGAAVTGMMPANAGGSMITATALPAFGGNDTVSFFDQSGTYISGRTTAVTAGGTITVPSTAAGVRLTINTSDAGAAMVYFGATLPGSYVAGGPPYPTNVVDAKLTTAISTATSAAAAAAFALQPQGANFFDQTQITVGSLLDSGNGDTLGTLDGSLGGGYCVSGFIPVLPGVAYNLRIPFSPTNSAFGIVWYNASKTPIIATPLPYPSPQNFTAPTGAAFVRFSDFTANAPTQMWTIGTTAPSTYVPFPQLPQVITQANISALNGQTIGVWGDSISSIFTQQWQNVVLTRTGATLGFQDARPGRAFSTAFECYGTTTPGATLGNYASTNGGISSGSYTYCNDPTFPHIGSTNGASLATELTGVKLMILRLGTNDQDISTGTLGDATSAGTLYGNMRWVIENLLTANPQMRLVMVGPELDGFGTYAQVAAVDAAEQAFANFYALPYLSLLKNSGNNLLTNSTYTRDSTSPSYTFNSTGGTTNVTTAGFGTHPSDWAFQHVDGPAIAQFILQWF